MKSVWVLVLLCGGCSLFVIQSPSKAKHRGQCETSRLLPVTEAVAAVAAGAGGYFIATDTSDDFVDLGGPIGGLLMVEAAIFALSSVVGLIRVGQCRDLPAAPQTTSRAESS